ncbi:carboxypeptidase regulatory-like domain-containing protein [Candidatus Poribacteria bacterium]|nr:carboxypeptidase regulatory-like domain-containing protein [Candidatus Poribacteria bacterium]
MKKEFLCYFILLTIILFGFGLKTEAQEEVATVRGTVVDSKGNSIKDAMVTTKPPTSEAVTQADGSYRLPSIAAGAYQIIAKTLNNRAGTTKIYMATATGNVIPEIKVRGSETFQSKLQKKWPAILSSFTLFPVGAGITLGFAEKKFRSSAHDAKKEFLDIIPISTDDYRLRMQSWEQYQRKVTRANWLSVTSGNLMLDSIPFYWHWVKGQPIGWKLALIYYGPKVVVFGSWSIIDWIRTADAQNQADALEQSLRYYEATAQQGKKGKYRERAEWLAANAALDVAIGFLAWRICSHQDDEQSIGLKLRYRMFSNQVALSVSGNF